MVTGLPSYFYFPKLDNLRRIIRNFSLECVNRSSIREYMIFKDSGTDLLIFRAAALPAVLKSEVIVKC